VCSACSPKQKHATQRDQWRWAAGALAASYFSPVAGSCLFLALGCRAGIPSLLPITYLILPYHYSNFLLSLTLSHSHSLALSPSHPLVVSPSLLFSCSLTSLSPLSPTLSLLHPLGTNHHSDHHHTTTLSHPCRPHLTRSPNPTLRRLPGCRLHHTASTRIVVPLAWRRVLEPQLAFSGIIASLLLHLTVPVCLSSSTPHRTLCISPHQPCAAPPQAAHPALYGPRPSPAA
jgi:hypothetical protein